MNVDIFDEAIRELELYCKRYADLDVEIKLYPPYKNCKDYVRHIYVSAVYDGYICLTDILYSDGICHERIYTERMYDSNIRLINKVRN